MVCGNEIRTAIRWIEKAWTPGSRLAGTEAVTNIRIYSVRCRSQWQPGLKRSLRPLAWWDCRFASRAGARMSLMSAACCQVEVYTSDWSLVQCMCLSMIVKPRQWRGPVPLGDAAPWGRNSMRYWQYCIISHTQYLHFITKLMKSRKWKYSHLQIVYNSLKLCSALRQRIFVPSPFKTWNRSCVYRNINISFCL